MLFSLLKGMVPEMRHHMKRFAWILIVVFMLTGCDTENARENTDDAFVAVRNAFDEMAGWKSCSFRTHINVDMMQGDAEDESDRVLFSYDIDGTVLSDPFRAHMFFNILMETVSDSYVSIEQYMEETDQGLLIYQTADVGWLKYYTKDEEMMYAATTNPMENVPEMRDHMTAARFVQAERIREQDAVKYEVVFSHEMYEKLLKNASIRSSSSESETVTYHIWLNEKNGSMLRYEAEIGNLPDANESLRGTLSIEADFYAHDEDVKVFDIPEQVVQNAVEAEASPN
jgi:hypothetical protein